MIVLTSQKRTVFIIFFIAYTSARRHEYWRFIEKYWCVPLLMYTLNFGYKGHVSQAQKAKVSGDVRPRLRASQRTPQTFLSISRQAICVPLFQISFIFINERIRIRQLLVPSFTRSKMTICQSHPTEIRLMLNSELVDENPGISNSSESSTNYA